MQEEKPHSTRIIEILEGLISNISGEQITVEQIVDQLNHRGFGPLLAVLALLVIIVGAIPFVPALVGIIIAFICLQMLFGYKHPTLPKLLQNLKIKKSLINTIIKFLKPFAQKMGVLIKRRYTFFFNRFSDIIISATCICLALCIIFLGFIPFLPLVFCAPIFMFGIAYTVEDGLLIVLGYILIIIACWFLFIH